MCNEIVQICTLLISDGYFSSTVGKLGDENMIANYVKNQGQEYRSIERCTMIVSWHYFDTMPLAAG